MEDAGQSGLCWGLARRRDVEGWALPTVLRPERVCEPIEESLGTPALWEGGWRVGVVHLQTPAIEDTAGAPRPVFKGATRTHRPRALREQGCGVGRGPCGVPVREGFLWRGAELRGRKGPDPEPWREWRDCRG